jgi:hypothetical protein
LGYLLVNNGKLVEAIIHFSKLIQHDSTVFGAFIGRGTAYALGGELQTAEKGSISHFLFLFCSIFM